MFSLSFLDVHLLWLRRDHPAAWCWSKIGRAGRCSRQVSADLQRAWSRDLLERQRHEIRGDTVRVLARPGAGPASASSSPTIEGEHRGGSQARAARELQRPAGGDDAGIARECRRSSPVTLAAARQRPERRDAAAAGSVLPSQAERLHRGGGGDAGRQRVRRLHHRHLRQHAALRVADGDAQDAGDAGALPAGEGHPGDERPGRVHVPALQGPVDTRLAGAAPRDHLGAHDVAADEQQQPGGGHRRRDPHLLRPRQARQPLHLRRRLQRHRGAAGSGRHRRHEPGGRRGQPARADPRRGLSRHRGPAAERAPLLHADAVALRGPGARPRAAPASRSASDAAAGQAHDLPQASPRPSPARAPATPVRSSSRVTTSAGRQAGAAR